ncbi:MAG: hypothetical protein JRH16_00140 [Deltaproteobacteria bacterium]|nr:hypothetical protein [Deltaproteobacteria bacterium]MBW2359371.1 hypothetical protein [Deltaproteobacteria bacterium]
MQRRHLHILITCVVVAAVHVALVHWYRHGVMGYGIAERTLQQFESLREQVDIVALGDSHVKWGIEAEAIPGAFNFALPGESYVQSYYRLRSLLDDEGQVLRAVVLPADPHSLARHSDHQFRHYYAAFVDPFELGRVDGEMLHRVIESLRGRLAPYAGQRANLLAYLETGRPPEVRWLDEVPMHAGSLASDRLVTAFSPAGRRAKAQERMGYHFGQAPGLDPTLGYYLGKLLSLCAERGIRVLLVRFPLGDAYLEALPDPAASDAMIARMVDASENAELLDARRVFANRPQLFADVDHLNREGAALLSRRVARRLAR